MVSTIPGGPADKANLNDGDIIESIDGKSTRDMSLATLQLMLEGQSGTSVELSVIRPRRAVPEKIQITRADVPLPSTGEVFYEGASILYIKPGVLDREHVNQVEQKAQEHGKN